MSGASSTVQVIDPRIEPQPEPVYLTTVSPTQSQYYSLPPSAKSDSYIAFNNIVTRGTNKAYLDTFQLRITATITLTCKNTKDSEQYLPKNLNDFILTSFPFNRCCEEIRANVNGVSFFSFPLTYLPAKERYWDQDKMIKSFQNSTPCIKAYLGNEEGVRVTITDGQPDPTLPSREMLSCYPSRMQDTRGWAYGPSGPLSCTQRDCYPVDIREGVHAGETKDIPVTITWEEPIFCSPFSSRYDETYGRPLYNLTSLDLAFNLQNLQNMFRVKHCNHTDDEYEINGYTVHIEDCQLLYQVMTIPPSITPPTSTVVPYRRIVPYITDAPSNVPFNTTHNTTTGSTKVSVTSGVYTLNEVPQAIWIFGTHPLSAFQMNPRDGVGGWTSNKMAVPLTHINISMGNTTQILNTATQKELYRIAKANGLQDTWAQFALPYLPANGLDRYCLSGVGSYLRLIPGTDIVIPGERLIPGSNAKNMVFQVTADFEIPNSWYLQDEQVTATGRKFSLWILFEYVGVARWTPGQCQIVMNPVASAPSSGVISTSEVSSGGPTTAEAVSGVEGSGWLDKVKNFLSNAYNSLQKSHLISKLTGAANQAYPGNPWISGADRVANALGLGEIDDDDSDPVPAKRYRGGAVMGLGDFT